MRLNVRQAKERLQNMGEKRFAHPAQGQAGQGHTELCSGKVSVEMGTNIFGKTRPSVPLLYQGVELARSHFYNREFAGDEETVQRDQRGDDRQLGNQNRRSIPVSDDRVAELGAGNESK